MGRCECADLRGVWHHDNLVRAGLIFRSHLFATRTVSMRAVVCVPCLTVTCSGRMGVRHLCVNRALCWKVCAKVPVRDGHVILVHARSLHGCTLSSIGFDGSFRGEVCIASIAVHAEGPLSLNNSRTGYGIEATRLDKVARGVWCTLCTGHGKSCCVHEGIGRLMCCGSFCLELHILFSVRWGVILEPFLQHSSTKMVQFSVVRLQAAHVASLVTAIRTQGGFDSVGGSSECLWAVRR